MKLVVALLVLLLVLSAAGCSGTYFSEERSPGEEAFAANCRSCHRLPDPSSQDDSQWPELVKRYGDKANLSTEIQAVIIDYLTNSN